MADRIQQIAATATRVACTDTGVFKAFLPAAVSGHFVISEADLVWLLDMARIADRQIRDTAEQYQADSAAGESAETLLARARGTIALGQRIIEQQRASLRRSGGQS